MIRASIPVIRVLRQENKDLVARLTFHEGHSSMACVEKKKTFARQKNLVLHGNLYHKLCPQRQSILML